MEANHLFVRLHVHFPDVDTMVASASEILDPTACPLVRILQNTGRVRVLTCEETRPARRATGCSHMTICKGDTLVREPVEMRRDHMRIPQRRDGIETLLIRDNENDIGACVAHCKRL